MKILFMGTPGFAEAALEALIGAGHDIVAVVTQPDKPKGRSKELLPPPVKECALRHGIPVLQPVRVKKPEAVAALREYPADIYVVAAFGQILSQEILDIPPLGSLCIHASLLPKYRGASPIQHAILAGEERTGVTIMQMDAGIDTGDMLYKKETAISPKDTYETLHDKLMRLGGEAVTEALVLLGEGKLVPEKQQEGLSCYAPLIGKEMGRIDFSEEACAIDRRIRAMTPWPGAFTGYRGRQLKIWRAEPELEAEGAALSDGQKRGILRTEKDSGVAAGDGAEKDSAVAGEILRTEKDCIVVAAGKGTLRIYELQLEGRKRMGAHDFLLGVKMQPGEILG